MIRTNRSRMSNVKKAILIALLVFATVFIGCNSGNVNQTDEEDKVDVSPKVTSNDTVISEDSPPLIDNDHDGINDSIEDELIESFAPIVKLNPEEQYLPANVPWYLSRVRMRYNVKFGFDDQILEQGTLNLTNLLAQTHDSQSSGLSQTPTEFFLEATDKNGGDSLDDHREETRKGTQPSNWVCYTHVRTTLADNQKHMYDIQYIFFYSYNGDMAWGAVESAHEADFEHITVRVEGDLQTIYQIYYAAHEGEGRWYSRETYPGAKDGYSVTADGRPIVYSALDSHASYPWTGEWERGRLETPNDFTKDDGPEWDCRTNIVNLGEKPYPRADMQWIQYSGHWGEIGEMSWTTGPYGPAYQNWWNSDPQ